MQEFEFLEWSRWWLQSIYGDQGTLGQVNGNCIFFEDGEKTLI